MAEPRLHHPVARAERVHPRQAAAYGKIPTRLREGSGRASNLLRAAAVHVQHASLDSAQRHKGRGRVGGRGRRDWQDAVQRGVQRAGRAGARTSRELHAGGGGDVGRGEAGRRVAREGKLRGRLELRLADELVGEDVVVPDRDLDRAAVGREVAAERRPQRLLRVLKLCRAAAAGAVARRAPHQLALQEAYPSAVVGGDADAGEGHDDERVWCRRR